MQRAQQLARQAAQQDTTNYQAWRMAAETAIAAGEFGACSQYGRQALALKRDDVESLYLLGTSLAQRKEFTEAAEHLGRALKLAPAHWRASNNLGNVYRETGRHEEALACYERVFANPECPPAVLSNILLGLHFHLDGDHQRQFDMQCAAGSRIETAAGTRPPPPRRVRGSGKIRIGYFSPRFKPGVIGDFFLPLFDAHDRERFELHLFSGLEGSNACSQYLARQSDSWTETRGLSDQEFAQAVRAREVDIMVDLAGHTPGNRLGAFALRPAQVQITMLDNFDTSGMTVFDFFVTDHCATPVDGEQRFTEQLIRLPGQRLVYRPSDQCPDVAPLPALKNRFITFGSFNRSEKMTPAVTQLWAGILQRLPEARLVLKDRAFGNADVSGRFRSVFERLGVESSRLEFRCWSDHRSMLEEYADIDMALDPFPYNGGLTSCEALWMGVPVLSLLGSRIISRQSACIMRSVGLDSFVSLTQRQYARAAERWANDIEGLANIRRKLRDATATSPLMNAAAHARELEANFVAMIQR